MKGSEGGKGREEEREGRKGAYKLLCGRHPLELQCNSTTPSHRL